VHLTKASLLRLAVLDCKIITGGLSAIRLRPAAGNAPFSTARVPRRIQPRPSVFAKTVKNKTEGGGLVSLSATALGVGVSGRRYSALLEHRSPEITGQMEVRAAETGLRRRFWTREIGRNCLAYW